MYSAYCDLSGVATRRFETERARDRPLDGVSVLFFDGVSAAFLVGESEPFLVGDTERRPLAGEAERRALAVTTSLDFSARSVTVAITVSAAALTRAVMGAPRDLPEVAGASTSATRIAARTSCTVFMTCLMIINGAVKRTRMPKGFKWW